EHDEDSTADHADRHHGRDDHTHDDYSVAIAVRTSSREARHAGASAATTPASIDRNTKPASWPPGMLNVVMPWDFSAVVNTQPHSSPMPVPTRPPTTAMITDSPRTIRRS